MTAAASAAFAGVLNRIARATSIVRTRSEDAEREARHHGEVEDVARRIEAAAIRLERVAVRLERAISEVPPA